jgi:hypothetical protein
MQVFKNRSSLLNTLRDNQTVIRQVEIAIGALFVIFWLFIATALFDGGAVMRTWTAMSAGLLSFSFIFGNSIREVCFCVHVLEDLTLPVVQVLDCE